MNLLLTLSINVNRINEKSSVGCSDMCIIQLLTSYKFLLADDRTALHRVVVEDCRSTNWASNGRESSIGRERTRQRGDAVMRPDTSLRGQSGRSESAARQKEKDLNKRLINPINQLIQESQPHQKVSQRSDLWATRDHWLINWLIEKFDQLTDNTYYQSVDQGERDCPLNWMFNRLVNLGWTKVNVEQWWGGRKPV